MLSSNKKQNRQNQQNNNSRNLIGITSKVTGDITSEGDYRIDGTLEGNLKTSGKVVIGKDGKFIGNLQCNSADIEGYVSGTINCKNILVIRTPANIEGEIFIEKLEVEPGAVFNGTCNMKGIKALKNENKETGESRVTAS